MSAPALPTASCFPASVRIARPTGSDSRPPPEASPTRPLRRDLPQAVMPASVLEYANVTGRPRAFLEDRCPLLTQQDLAAVSWRPCTLVRRTPQSGSARSADRPTWCSRVPSRQRLVRCDTTRLQAVVQQRRWYSRE